MLHYQYVLTPPQAVGERSFTDDLISEKVAGRPRLFELRQMPELYDQSRILKTRKNRINLVMHRMDSSQ